MVVCYTSFTYPYLSRARILAQTLRAAHPDWRLCALVVDKPPLGWSGGGFEKFLEEFDEVCDAETLAIPRFRSWLFKHDVVEACTAVKGQMLVELLERGAEKVVYLDPDIAVFHPLSAIERLLDRHSLVLTPHQTAANSGPRDVEDNELASLRYGVFNLGFLAVRNDANGRAFAKWWAEQLYRACYDDLGAGLFTDQKYCDLAPCLFDGVHIERNPGCNVASWNLSRRAISFGPGGEALVNGAPLRFYHFTKIEGVGDAMTERYAGDNFEVFEIWNWYKRRRAANEVAGVPPRYWRYGRFADGAEIPRALRLAYRRRPDWMDRFDDPFAVEGDSFRDWVARHEPSLLEP